MVNKALTSSNKPIIQHPIITYYSIIHIYLTARLLLNVLLLRFKQMTKKRTDRLLRISNNRHFVGKSLDLNDDVKLFKAVKNSMQK